MFTGTSHPRLIFLCFPLQPMQDLIGDGYEPSSSHLSLFPTPIDAGSHRGRVRAILVSSFFVPLSNRCEISQGTGTGYPRLILLCSLLQPMHDLIGDRYRSSSSHPSLFPSPTDVGSHRGQVRGILVPSFFVSHSNGHPRPILLCFPLQPMHDLIGDGYRSSSFHPCLVLAT